MKLTATSTSNAPTSRLTRKTATDLVLHPDLGPRVEGVTQAVAEHVQREHREHDRDTRDDREPGCGDDPRLAVGDQRPPGRVRRLYSGAEEREAGLGEDVVRDDQREEDEQGRGDVRQELAEHDPRRAGSLSSRRLDELLLTEREDLAAERTPDVGNENVRDDERRNPEAPTLEVDPEVMVAVSRDRGPERDRKQQDRKLPDEVEEAGDDPVDPTAEIACKQREYE